MMGYIKGCEILGTIVHIHVYMGMTDHNLEPNVCSLIYPLCNILAVLETSVSATIA